VAIDCRTVSGELAERDPSNMELEARGGTLFLDEVSDLTLEAQKRILVLFEDGPCDLDAAPCRVPCVRVIAATTRDLQALVEQGRFRQDLFWRLNVFPIALPPLRDRREDVVPLARQALMGAAGRLGRLAARFSAQAEEALARYDWPSNGRELVNVIDRAVLLAPGDEVGLDALPDLALDRARTPEPASEVEPGPPDVPPLTYREAVERASEAATKGYLEQLLARCNGNVTRAAGCAGIERQSLHRLLKRYAIQPHL
jgi:DNA-binding NtrC family response regulator